MSGLIERIDHDIDGCDDDVCDSCDLLKDCKAEIERLTEHRDELLDCNANLLDRVEAFESVYDAAHKAAMFCVRDGDGEAHIAPRYMQPLDDAINRAATEQETK